MSDPKRPLRELLRDATPDRATIDRLWDGTQDRLAPRRSRWRAFSLVAVPALAAAALLLVWWVQPSSPRKVRLASGQPLVTTTATSAVALALDDGSRVELSVGAVVEPRLNDRNETVLRLQTGRARFELTDRRHALWSVEVSSVIIQTRGAAFAAWRSDSAVEIEVYSGEVTLLGERVPSQRLRLGAGQHTSIPERTAVVMPPLPEAPVSRPPPPVEPSRPTKMRPSAPPPPSNRPLPAVPWRELAREHKYSEAYEKLSAPGVEEAARSLTTIDDLLQLADVARLSGHPVDAIAPLERASREFPSDRRAGVAAYTRARVLADDLHRVAPAAEAFAEAIRLGVPEALLETAHLRLVETRRDAGDRAGAEEAAARYEQRFPAGRLRDKIEKAIAK
jgi:transmembrane sensor